MNLIRALFSILLHFRKMTSQLLLQKRSIWSLFSFLINALHLYKTSGFPIFHLLELFLIPQWTIKKLLRGQKMIISKRHVYQDFLKFGSADLKMIVQSTHCGRCTFRFLFLTSNISSKSLISYFFSFFHIIFHVLKVNESLKKVILLGMAYILNSLTWDDFLK